MIELIPLDQELADQLAAGDLSFFGEAGLPAPLARIVRDMAGMQATLYRKTQAVEPWIGYLARLPGEEALVGSCSFVARQGGQVEIAYFTFPGLEGRGFGRRMAEALVEIGWDDPALEQVIAHTLPQENASTAILRRLGFEQTGESIDPDEGSVWLWTLARPG
jgi:RimJ/RimL family protein N-acetyltransferase